MGNTPNIFDFEGEDLDTFLATPVSNGTYSNLLDTAKVDASGNAASATSIDESAGQLWGNMVDDFIRKSYPLLRAVARGIIGTEGTAGDGITVNGSTYETTALISGIGGTAESTLTLHRHSTTLAPVILSARSHSDTSAHTVVSSGDGLFELYALGWDGTDYAFGGYLGFKVDGTPGSNDMPTKFVVSVAADGSQTLTERLTISPSGAAVITGSLAVSANVTPVTDGSGTLGTSALGWDVLWLKERDVAGVTGVSAHGVFVVDDSAPNAAWFVADDDTRRNLSRMPPIHMSAGTAITNGTKSFDATSYIDYVSLANAATSHAWWSVQIPHTYGGQALTLRVKWCGDTTNVGNVRFQYNMRLYVAGELETVLNGVTASVTVAAHGTASTLQIDNLSTNVSLDSGVAGESVRVRVGRLGSDGADSYTGAVHIHAVELVETVA